MPFLIEQFLLKRHHFALECNDGLFARPNFVKVFVDDFSGAVLAPYVPCSKVSLASLPDTMISGPLLQEEFWTDGVLLLRERRRLRTTDVLVQLDKPVAILLKRGARVQSASILFHGDLMNIPQVVMRTERNWHVFPLSYVDFVVRRFAGKTGLEFWMNSLDSGCLLFLESLPVAYISKMLLPVVLTIKIHILMEKAYAFHRNRSKPVQDRSVHLQ